MKTEKFVCRIGGFIKETAKAVMVNWRLELMHKDVEVGVWFPKSQLQEGKCQPWLLRAKMAELAEKFRYIQHIEIN